MTTIKSGTLKSQRQILDRITFWKDDLWETADGNILLGNHQVAVKVSPRAVDSMIRRGLIESLTYWDVTQRGVEKWFKRKQKEIVTEQATKKKILPMKPPQ
jgi:hypothetical protein